MPDGTETHSRLQSEWFNFENNGYSKALYRRGYRHHDRCGSQACFYRGETFARDCRSVDRWLGQHGSNALTESTQMPPDIGHPELYQTATQHR
jgi:hypothetical protein